MSVVVKDRVRESSRSTGVGDFILFGTAPTGCITFDAGFGHTGGGAVLFPYVISLDEEQESGLGYLSAATTLVRHQVTDSTNAGNHVDFASGLKDVFCDVTANIVLAAPNNLSDLPSVATARVNLGLGTLATQSGTFSGASSGTNTGDQTTVSGNAGTATALQNARTINGVSFNGTANITVADSTKAATANNLSDLASPHAGFDNLTVHGSDIASASTLNLDTATGDLVDVTGTAGITAITLANGRERTVRFTGVLTLTNGASLVLPGGANITTAAGDYAILRGYAAGVVRCVAYTKVSGTALAGAGEVPSGGYGSFPNAKYINAPVTSTINGNNDLYTVPSGRKALFYGGKGTNSTAGTVNVYPAVKISGTYYQLQPASSMSTGSFGTALPLFQTLGGLPILLNANEIVALNSDTVGVVYWAVIIEFDDTSPLKRAQITSWGTGDNTLLTVSNGKTAWAGTAGGQIGSSLNLLTFAYRNWSGGTRTVSVYLVPSGGSTGATNKIGGASVSTGGNMVNAPVPSLNSGDSIVINVDAGTATQFAWMNYMEI